MLRRLSRRKKNEVTEGWRKMRNVELYKLHSSSNTIRMIRSRKVRWVGRVASMGEMRNAYKFFLGKIEK
jgi:hypothetical protein